ncbi:MAG: hypothetical protein B6D63_03125 [Candidatus Latescibacteria bacterium 4484_7]|nr:MAG: hypothetical protein B6D63_03125 [Candidatus Latescibacteria bacterium 4484_7]
MGDKKIEFGSYKEMPMCAMSVDDMLWNHTGSWRNVRPYYDPKTSPCRTGCPAGEDIQRYIFLVTEKHYKEGWETIMRSNPMPSVTGRVCFHPCMDKCTRGDYDQAVNIPAIERALGDMAFENYDWIVKTKASKKQKVAVVGGGPAGLSCAYYAAKLGYAVTIFEKEKALGGVLRWGIPEYRLPNDVLDKAVKVILDSGEIDVKTEQAIGRDFSLEDLKKKYDAVFIGIGLSRSRSLGIDGENMEGVEAGLEFLKSINSGKKVSQGKEVVVIGGGNTAMDVARTARRIGSNVTVVYRRTMNEMPAIRDEIEEAEREGVRFRFLATPASIARGKGGKLSVVFQEMQLGEPDESGRRRPVPVEGKTFTMDVDKLFTAIGEEAVLDGLDSVEQEWSLIKAASRFGDTNIDGVFAGGDVVTGAASVVEAVAAGRAAAEKIDRYFDGKEDPAPEEVRTVGFKDMNTAYFTHAKRNEVPRISPEEALSSFDEIYRGFDMALLHREADRCFSCGVCNYCDNCWIFCPDVAISRGENEYEINYDYCKGCLVCVTECPRSVISTREEGK